VKFVTTEFKACILNHITKQRVAILIVKLLRNCTIWANFEIIICLFFIVSQNRKLFDVVRV